MTEKKLDLKGLEFLIKKTFCNMTTVVQCGYAKENWCPRSCGYYKNAEKNVKYWSR